jgi:hypothetical protein
VGNGNVFMTVGEILAGRFSPSLEAAEDTKRLLTLHDAIREAFGMGPDDGLVAYYEHREWLALSKQIHHILDETVREKHGPQVTAIAWSLAPGRTEAEVLEVLEVASQWAPDLHTPEPARSRPLPRNAFGAGKRRAAVCGMVCHLAGGLDSQIGEIIAQLRAEDELETLRDDDFLDRADSLAAAHELDPDLAGSSDMIRLLWKAWEASGAHFAGPFLGASEIGRAR